MKVKLIGCTALLGLALTSCVDDKYDLSDVDTTSRFQVNDLTVPVNIDNIYLSDIIKIEENSRIQIVTIDGKDFYAIVEKGNLESDPINVKTVTAKAPVLSPSHEILSRVSTDASSKADGDEVFSYQLKEMGNDFQYTDPDVDHAIISLEAAQINNLKFTIDLSTANVNFAEVSSMRFNDISIQMPKGMTAKASVGSYDAKTGVWSISNIDVTSAVTSIYLEASAINFAANDSKLENHAITLNSEFRILDGTLTIAAAAGYLPAEIEFDASYTLDDMVVTAIDGEINYYVEGLDDFSNIDLSDIPNFLKGDENNIALTNPTLFIQVNNPVADDNLTLSSGMTITAYRDGAAPRVFSPEKDVVINYNLGNDGQYNNVLSPAKPEAQYILPEYASNLQWVEFSTLGEIFAPAPDSSVKGIPSSVAIDLTDCQIPTQTVKNFPIGRTINPVKGNYEFLAPFAMVEDSEIVYVETKENWDVDFLKDMVVTKLTVEADIQNNTPSDIRLVILPLNSKGEQINNVEFSSNTVAAQSEGHVEFNLTGEITDLDGVILKAYVISRDGNTPLTPDQDLVMTNIRAKVTGYYDTDF